MRRYCAVVIAAIHLPLAVIATLVMFLAIVGTAIYPFVIVWQQGIDEGFMPAHIAMMVGAAMTIAAAVVMAFALDACTVSIDLWRWQQQPSQ